MPQICQKITVPIGEAKFQLLNKKPSYHPTLPGEEKHLHLAQLQQDGGQPAGEVKAVLLPVHQPPAAVFFRFKCSVCGLIWLAAARAASETS